MAWSQGGTSLCSVNSEGTMLTHGKHSLSDFYCDYKDGQLSLVFQRMLPLESGHSKPYRCKLHSNQGVAYNYTKVELQGKSPRLLLFRQTVTSMFSGFLFKCAKPKQIWTFGLFFFFYIDAWALTNVLPLLEFFKLVLLFVSCLCLQILWTSVKQKAELPDARLPTKYKLIYTYIKHIYNQWKKGQPGQNENFTYRSVTDSNLFIYCLLMYLLVYYWFYLFNCLYIIYVFVYLFVFVLLFFLPQSGFSDFF